MTPFEKKGWDKDQLFEVVIPTTFTKGSIVQLYRDDRSSSPMFKLIEGVCYYTLAGELQGAYLGLDRIKPINNSNKQPEKQVKKKPGMKLLKRMPKSGKFIMCWSNEKGIWSLAMRYVQGSLECYHSETADWFPYRQKEWDNEDNRHYVVL